MRFKHERKSSKAILIWFYSFENVENLKIDRRKKFPCYSHLLCPVGHRSYPVKNFVNTQRQRARLLDLEWRGDSCAATTLFSEQIASEFIKMLCRLLLILC